jgi:hypothetical protein
MSKKAQTTMNNMKNGKADDDRFPIEMLWCDAYSNIGAGPLTTLYDLEQLRHQNLGSDDDEMSAKSNVMLSHLR